MWPFSPLLLLLLLVSPLADARWDPKISKCPPLPAHTTTTIRDLRPNTVGVVAALGDSITAGFGIEGILGTVEEYRGKSGLIGGDRDALTSANFMAHYNPSVQGRALGHHIGEMASAHYEYHPAVDQLNAAMSGARAEMLVNQTVYLKSMMRSNPRIDWNNDWKIVGILIGANDGCSMCRKGGQYRNITQAADNFESEVRAAIASLAQVPRVLVNVLPMLTNMTNLWRLNEASLYCRTIHDTLARSECGCAFFGGKNETDTLYFDKSLNAFADRLERIVADWQSNGNNDTFAVTMQPFFRYINFPTISYLSSLDCFHPSLFAHGQVAVSGWNSLFKPLANKTRTWTPDEPLYCPTPNDIIYAN